MKRRPEAPSISAVRAVNPVYHRGVPLLKLLQPFSISLLKVTSFSNAFGHASVLNYPCEDSQNESGSVNRMAFLELPSVSYSHIIFRFLQLANASI